VLINSHWHMDHWMGNAAYADAYPGLQIMATAETRDYMARLPLEFFVNSAGAARAKATLDRLSAIGLSLSVDDFGTGYSSLANLKRLPVDVIKIDKSFVMDMAIDASDAAIVRSTIDLAHNLGLRVVAEGVESHQAWTDLKELGCDLAQGFYVSRPLPAADLGRLLRERAAAEAEQAAEAMLERPPLRVIRAS